MSSKSHQLTPQLTQTDEAIRIMRMPEVLVMTGLRSRRYIYTLVKNGELPRPVKLRKGGRASGWPAAAVHEFVRRMEIDPLAPPVKLR
ncbi:AlpA family phage regulatory protein [Acidocella sp.]|uniref:helix-turn-helix transcriptional regulator n=1 Tax=Acidocella sp. TaxID=50710 RepID=UPI00185CE5DD|nr:AlpA family phage regulatory protein [Acidocella sp.]